VIVEHALLRIRDGEVAAFEEAMRGAVPLIAASPGFRDIEVRPSVEAPGFYLLRVSWDDVESHRDGFRRSERYQRWRALLHRFYELMPEVSYFGPSIIDSPAAA
jgi:heme-degrading monooxygenase HmoA